MGMIKIFAGSYAPRGWMYCSGQRLEVARFSALYGIIGEMYGGDGSTFNLPNLNGRVPIGVSEKHYLATTGGSEEITLTTQQLPAHSHNVAATAALNVSDAGADVHKPTADKSVLAAATYLSGRESVDARSFVDDKDPNVKLSAKSVTVNVTQQSVGENAKVNIMQPFMAMSYIICVEGLYPPRP